MNTKEFELDKELSDIEKEYTPLVELKPIVLKLRKKNYEKSNNKKEIKHPNPKKNKKNSFIKQNKTKNFKNKEISSDEEISDSNSSSNASEDLSSESNDSDDEIYVESMVDFIYPELEKEENLSREKFKEIVIDNIDFVRDAVDFELEVKSWTKDLKSDEIETYKPVFKQIETMIMDEEPSIVKILKSNLTDEEKKECLLLNNIKTTCTPGSFDYYEVRSRLITILKQAENRNRTPEQMELEQKLKDTNLNKNSQVDRILNLNCSFDIKKILYEKYRRLESIQPQEAEYSTIKTQLEWGLSLPYDNVAPSPIDLNKSSPIEIEKFFSNFQKRMDEELFGLKVAKQKITLLLSDSYSRSNSNKVIALCGPTGIGKTSIAEAFAKAANLPFANISLGGAKDSTMFYGSDNVYIGASPGIIVRTLKNLGCSNGVILFDEIDKIEDRELQYALLHITDFTQNKMIRDKFLSDIPIDISKIWFFYSMNDEKLLDKALRDRLNPIIHIEDYTVDEKKIIIRNYILKNELATLSINEQITIDDEVLIKIIQSGEDGLRSIKAMIKYIASKINFYKLLGGNIENFRDLYNSESYFNSKNKNLSNSKNSNKNKSFKIEFPLNINMNNIHLFLNLQTKENLSYYN